MPFLASCSTTIRFIARVLLLAILAFAVTFSCCLNGVAAEPLDSKLAKEDEKTSVLWFDIQLLGIEGKAWSDVQEPFDRLPAKAEKIVRPAVWKLSKDSAGMCVRFVTDATTIHARWTLQKESLAMGHMPATGVSGLDLYVKGDDGQWKWLANGRPAAVTNTAQLVSGIPTGTREYLLYLPLYNGVKSVEIGVPKSATLSKATPRSEKKAKPIVFWGTSITQGGCASRPGMVHTAILGRRLDWSVVNLGFSGNGKMEPEVAELLAEIDAAVYVIDCLPNCTAAEVAERTAPLVQILRKARPNTPILLVEDRSYSNAFLVTSSRDRNTTSRAAFKKAYDDLTTAGVKGLSYLTGDHLLGNDNEGTVDSSHPTDLGFMRQADAFEKALIAVVVAVRWEFAARLVEPGPTGPIWYVFGIVAGLFHDLICAPHSLKGRGARAGKEPCATRPSFT